MGYVEERINFQTNFFNGISFFEKNLNIIFTEIYLKYWIRKTI